MYISVFPREGNRLQQQIENESNFPGGGPYLRRKITIDDTNIRATKNVFGGNTRALSHGAVTVKSSPIFINVHRVI